MAEVARNTTALRFIAEKTTVSSTHLRIQQTRLSRAQTSQLGRLSISSASSYSAKLQNSSIRSSAEAVSVATIPPESKKPVPESNANAPLASPETAVVSLDLDAKDAKDVKAAKDSKDAKDGEKAQGKAKTKGTSSKKVAPAALQRRQRDWEKAKELLLSGKVWRSKVESINGGGARLRFGSLLAFLPFSQLEPRRTPDGTNNWESLVGSHVTVQVMEADQGKSRFLVSEKKAQKKLRMEELIPGQVRPGIVSGVMDYGAFVDLLGQDGTPLGVGGLVHVSELSWDAVLSPAAVVSIGQNVRVKVLRVEKGKGRLALSIKQVQSDPLYQTLDALLPSSDAHLSGGSLSGMLASQQPLAEELLGAPLPGLPELCDSLRQHQGVLEVSLGRQALERRVVSQDLELWLSSKPVEDGQFTLVARAGRQVQEVFVKSTLDREGMKAAVLQVTTSIL